MVKTRSGKSSKHPATVPPGKVAPTASRKPAGKKSSNQDKKDKKQAKRLIEECIRRLSTGPFRPSLADFQDATSKSEFENATEGSIKQWVCSQICEDLPGLSRSVKLLLYSGIFDLKVNEIAKRAHEGSIYGIFRVLRTRFKKKYFVYLDEFLHELEGDTLWFWVCKMLFWLDYKIIEAIEQALNYTPNYEVMADELLQEFFLQYDSVSPAAQDAVRGTLISVIEDIDEFLDIPDLFSKFKQSLPNKPPSIKDPPSIKKKHRDLKLCIRDFEKGLNEDTEYWRAQLEKSESLQHFVAEFTNPTTVSYILNKYQSLQKLKERLSLEPSAARQVINFDAI